MLGNASPRKPKVAMRNRSSSLASLLVECLSTASTRSSAAMPSPLSLTRITAAPLFSIQTKTSVAPASNEFSISSFTTEAGRSTTSPAAMRLAISSESIRIFTTRKPPHSDNTVGPKFGSRKQTGNSDWQVPKKQNPVKTKKGKPIKDGLALHHFRTGGLYFFPLLPKSSAPHFLAVESKTSLLD